jgi:hypothetical protein
MAKTKTKAQTTVVKKEKPKVARPGVHAKTKTSKAKNATNYKKPNVGQG